MTLYSGAGNTFLVEDDRSGTFPVAKIPDLCGTSIDGVILLRPNFSMAIFNSDGSEASMCGNGLRCLVAFLKDLGIEEKEYVITTRAGIYRAYFEGDEIAVIMQPPKIYFLDDSFSFLDTGVPHAVFFVDDVESIDVNTEGRQIRFDPFFGPQGTNVNFVEKGSLKMRTYERGVERETRACGTGATAAAIAAHLQFNLPSPLVMEMASKEKITISFDSQFQKVVMKGRVNRCA